MTRHALRFACRVGAAALLLCAATVVTLRSAESAAGYTTRCNFPYTNYEGMNRVLDKLDIVAPCGSTTTINPVSGSHLDLNSVNDNRSVRLNSRAFTQASGDSIGFQSKPNQTVATTGSVQGGQISPRCASGIACTTLIGLHVDTDLKGTAAGNVTDVRVLELEMVSDVGSGRTISGDAAVIKTRNNVSSTISGDAVVGITPPSEATAYTAFWKFPTATANLALGTATPAALPANTGYIRVKIGSTYLKIPLYAD